MNSYLTSAVFSKMAYFINNPRGCVISLVRFNYKYNPFSADFGSMQSVVKTMYVFMVMELF